jgi:hypothetical protein
MKERKKEKKNQNKENREDDRAREWIMNAMEATS